MSIYEKFSKVLDLKEKEEVKKNELISEKVRVKKLESINKLAMEIVNDKKTADLNAQRIVLLTQPEQDVNYRKQTLSVEEINEEIKTLKETNNVSDGYHTFGELYDHRIENFLALVKAIHVLNKFRLEKRRTPLWYSMNHSDGGKVYKGWFVAGIDTSPGKQITYHIPIEYLSQFEAVAKPRKKAPTYDGHTSEDVVERISKLKF